MDGVHVYVAREINKVRNKLKFMHFCTALDDLSSHVFSASDFSVSQIYLVKIFLFPEP